MVAFLISLDDLTNTFDKDGRHSHTCVKPDCKTSWKHHVKDFDSENYIANVDAHRCPKCGTENYHRDEVCVTDCDIVPSEKHPPRMSSIVTAFRGLFR